MDSGGYGHIPAGPQPAGGPISRRITLAVTLVALATLLVVGVVYYNFIGRYVLERERDRLITQTVQVVGQIEAFQGEFAARPELADRALQALARVNQQALSQGSAIIVYMDGVPVAVGGAARMITPATASDFYGRAQAIADKGPGAIMFVSKELREEFVLAAAPVELPEGKGIVAIMLPVPEAVATRQGLFRVLLYAGLFGLGLAILVGLGLGSWLARPLRRLSKVARSMAGGSYGEAVTGSYPGEVYELASSMETMRHEVQRSESSLRGFVASAAHELRTPLTSIEGFSQALLDGTAASGEEQQRSAAAIHREAARLHRLVDTLLTLSRFDSKEYRPNLVSTDVGVFVREEVGHLEEAGMAEPGRILVTVADEATATVDPDMLRQVVANLLRNAVQYGGEEPIEARVLVAGAWLEIYVKNGGRSIPAEDRGRIFERFYRGKTAGRVEGFGLGLPLVREICMVLGGDIQLLGPGPETVFLIRLPREPASSASG